MKFKVKAIKQDGSRYEETREAPDKSALSEELKQRGETPISVEEEIETPKKKSQLELTFLSWVSTNDKIVLARNLGAMLEAGLPLTRGLSVLERQARNGKLKAILSKIQSDVNKGKPLSEGFAGFPKVFPAFFVSMVKAGEESGSIAQSLKMIASQMEKIHTLIKRLRGAMIYPAIVITAMMVISVLLLIFLVPTLTATFNDLHLELPLSTRIIIAISTVLKDHTILAILCLFVVGGSFYLIIRTKKGKRTLDFVLLKLPIVSGLVKESNSAKTARTLSSLLSAGVDFLVAIQITKEVVQNVYYKNVLSEAEEKVRKGGTISSVLLGAEYLYPPFVGEMINIGEETGKISQMLGNTADFYEESVDQKTKNLSTVIEPLLMIFIGIFVGIFAVSMLGPIYSLAGAI